MDWQSAFKVITIFFTLPGAVPQLIQSWCVTELHFFNPYADIRFTANRLPHWQQSGAVYFVTFRLADAVPHHVRTQWESEREAWLRIHPRPWSCDVEREYHKRFSGAMERWLDAGHGSCILRRSDCAEIVIVALRYFDGQRLTVVSSVVMPNHVHALFVQNPDWPLKGFCAVERALLHGKLTRCSAAKAAFGSPTISTG
jgi:hypothetical protein